MSAVQEDPVVGLKLPREISLQLLSVIFLSRRQSLVRLRRLQEGHWMTLNPDKKETSILWWMIEHLSLPNYKSLLQALAFSSFMTRFHSKPACQTMITHLQIIHIV